MTRPSRPSRDDYALCECRRAQEEGESTCGGCEEYQAARDRWARYEVELEAADDARMDLAKEWHRG
ncbi:MAG TPA: hypothetical protein VJ140_10145 [Actinomycetota bacterium]|nr:hypothetical protein [Actinomycetota bacterium]